MTSARGGVRLAMVLTVAAVLGGCATTGGGTKGDPIEGWNRAVFGFNEGLDTYVLKPVATGYKTVVPQFVRTGVSNVFNNLGDVWSVVNLMLQGRFADSAQSTMRVVTNTVFGIGGLFDAASDMGLDRPNEDMGQTLGAWGLGSGPYIVWPLLGPSSLRDSAGLPFDLLLGSPSSVYIDNSTVVYGVGGLRLINTRASLLGASEVVDSVALDKYTFIRDGYLSRRRSLVYNGDPPPLDEEPLDDPAAAAGAAAPGPAASAPPK